MGSARFVVVVPQGLSNLLNRRRRNICGNEAIIINEVIEVGDKK